MVGKQIIMHESQVQLLAPLWLMVVSVVSASLEQLSRRAVAIILSFTINLSTYHMHLVCKRFIVQHRASADPCYW